MHPVILISHTPTGDAFRYSRIANRECTHVVETEPAPIGTERNALSRADVELFRTQPEKVAP